MMQYYFIPFSALTLLVKQQEDHPAYWKVHLQTISISSFWGDLA